MSKKILIVNQNSGYLTIDVANAFKEQYDEVVLMFGLNRVTERTLHPDIKIQKTITYDRSSSIKRIRTWGICTVHLFFLLLFKYRGYHVLYYTNPPMSYFNSLFFSYPFSIVVFDTYPDALRLIGMKEKSLPYRFWSWVNKKVFSQAEKIVTLSEGMKSQLSQYVNSSKVKVVSIWPASETFKPIPKYQNPFLIKHGWQDKFIVLYSGNMGIGHKLEVIIDVAESVQESSEILFLFIGGGAKEKNLQSLVRKRRLDNVMFLPWQEAEVLPFSLAAADVAIVALEPEATHASVPSKTLNCLSVGLPIIAICDVVSSLAGLINNFQCGFVTDGNDASKVASFIQEVKESASLHATLSINSKQAAENFTKENAYLYI